MKKIIKIMFTVAIGMILGSYFYFSASDAADYTLINGSNVMSEAPQFSIGTEYAATLTGDEVLYFKFITPKQKGYYDFYAKNITIPTHSWANDGRAQFDIIDAVSEKKSTHNLFRGYEGTSNMALEPDTVYYIKVHNNYMDASLYSGNFKFSISYTADNVMDTKESATQISRGEKITSTLDGSEDVDYFKFTTGNWKQYELTAQNINIPTHSWASSYQFYVRVLSEIDETEGELRLAKGEAGSVVMQLSPNTTYYIRIADPEKTKGRYAFTIAEKQYVSDVKLKKSSLKIAKGKSYELLKQILPANATNKKLTWTSSNKSVATVNENGCVKAKYPGTATITAETQDGSEIKVSCSIIVKPSKAKIKSCKRVKGRNVRVKVKKQNGVYGIQYQLSRSKKFKGKKSSWYAYASTTIADTAPLKKGKRYYFRVRTYIYVNGNKVYGAWSDVKSVKTKGKKYIRGSEYNAWKSV